MLEFVRINQTLRKSHLQVGVANESVAFAWTSFAASVVLFLDDGQRSFLTLFVHLGR